MQKESAYTGADTGIHSGGCEILKRENYTEKGKKGDYLFKTRPDSNVFNGFFLILY